MFFHLQKATEMTQQWALMIVVFRARHLTSCY